MEEDPNIKVKKIKDILNISESTIKRDILKLKELNVIKRN